MKKLTGVIPAIPTPLDREENVDEGGLCRVIDHVLAKGAAGVFVLGTMGEGAALADEQKVRAVAAAVRHAAGRAPILAGVAEVSTRRAVALGRRLEAEGADALVVTTPYFYQFPHPESILGFMKAMGEGVGAPLVFYNTPARTSNAVDIETLDAIMNMPAVVGIKDSTGDAHLLLELLRRYPDAARRPCALMQGDESMYDVSLLMGADGVVGGAVTVFMETTVALYEAARVGDRDGAFRLQRELTRQIRSILGRELMVDWMHGVKKALCEMGLCEDTVTSPFLRRL